MVRDDGALVRRRSTGAGATAGAFGPVQGRRPHRARAPPHRRRCASRTRKGRSSSDLRLDRQRRRSTFSLGKGPLLGFGEGGPQFDRKGATYTNRNGQGGYQLRTHGATRADSVAGQHRRLGTVHPSAATAPSTSPAPTGVRDARQTTRAAARSVRHRRARSEGADGASTRASPGFAEMPPLWTFGYMQSHRTLAGPDEIIWVARTFREKKLPCDALIYLGTEFTPSGWNTRNGEFAWQPTNFPDPEALHRRARTREHFKVVAAHRHRGPAHERRGERSVHARKAVPSGRTPDDRWPDDRAGAVLLAVHKPLFDRRRRRLVARSGRRSRRRVATRAHPHVLGRAADVSPERAAVRAAPQRLGRHAALRRVHLVGRRLHDRGRR